MAIGVVGNDKSNNLLGTNKNNKYYDQSFHLDLEDTNESHAIICQQIKKGATVLDVGCSQGLIGSAIHKEMDCTVYGIELDKEAAEYAKKTESYVEVYSFDITNEKSKEYSTFFDKKLQFDYILFADVLEHVYNPANVLYRFSSLLKENGKILISLPNIAHYDIVNGLLNEQFNYADMGLLDNTHIRFFTKYSFAEYIRSANKEFEVTFDVKVVGKTIIQPPFLGKYPYLDQVIQKNEDLCVLQHIFQLEKVKGKTSNLDNLLSEDRMDLTKTINDGLALIEKEKELEKVREENTTLRDNIDFLYNEYNRMLNSKSWKITKPIRKFKALYKKIKLKLNSKTDQKQSILFLVHAWANVYDKSITNVGGTTLHVLDIINQIKTEKNCYVLTIINNKYMLVTFDANGQKIYDLNLPVKTMFFDQYDFDFLYMVNKLIDKLCIDLVHIHHIIGFPCDIRYISKKVRTILTVHDYTLLCPRFFLINKDNKLCANGSKQDCNICLKEHKINFNVRNNAVKLLLESVDNVIVPDESIINEFNHYYSISHYEIIPHGIDTTQFEPFKLAKKELGEQINIAFVGLIDKHKGLQVIKDLIFNNKNENITYHIFGTPLDSCLQKNQKNYIYHGIYNKLELPRLLNENKIDLVLLLSTCPESYNYTLSEVAFAKVPTMSFNIGAIANRLKKDKIGWIVEDQKEFDYKNILAMYDKALNKDAYNKVIDNLKKYKDVDIKDMVAKTVAIYDKMYIVTQKKYYPIQRFIDGFYLKYKL